MCDFESSKKKVKKIQKIVFEMLCAIDDFCSENNITYFLSGGTCLGAVRHQGFIPWDDDADIMMPRQDYESFLSIFSSTNSSTYGIGALSIDNNWEILQSRIWDKRTRLKYKNLDVDEIGVYIDIFPIDGLPSKSIFRNLHFRYSKILCALGSSCVKTGFSEGEGYRFIKKMVHIFTRHMNPRFFFERMDRNARKYDFYKSKYVGAIMAAHYGDRETIEQQLMNKACYLNFEGRMFPVPIGYDQYLKNLYGDYMTIPKDAAENGYTHLNKWVVEFLNKE